jgi:hypothetical protein
MSPDPAIIGRVRTRDPDLGHFSPDFDSGSGHGSVFTDPGPGARLKARTFLDFLRTFYGLFRTRLVPEKICSGVRVKGGTASIKIWVKTRKIVGSASLLFKLHSSFLHE